MSVVAGDPLQAKCDAMRAIPPQERPPDALRVFSQSVHEIQRAAKEKIRTYYAITKRNSQGVVVNAEHDMGEQRQQEEERASELRMQAMILLQRAVEVGREIRAACLVEAHHRGSHDSTEGPNARDTTQRRETDALQLLQPPLIAAQMLLLVRETHVMMQKLLVSGAGVEAASQRTNRMAVEHAKHAYELTRLVAVIVQRQREAAATSTSTENGAAMRQLETMEKECNILQFAKSEMQLASLRDRTGQREGAVKHNREAVRILTSLSAHGKNTGKDHSRMATEATQLLPVVLFNLGCQLEQIASTENDPERRQNLFNETRVFLERAREVGVKILEPGHPLLRKLQRHAGDSCSFFQADERAAMRGSGVDAAFTDALGTAAYVFPQVPAPDSSTPGMMNEPHFTRGAIQNSLHYLPRLPIGIKNNERTHPIDHFANLSLHSASTVSDPQRRSTMIRNSVRARKLDLQLKSTQGFLHSKRKLREVDQSLLQCHRLRHPSDALRLGGIAVIDTVLDTKHAEAEKEKKRKEEEKKIVRRQRRQRSFLPEDWNLEEDAPVVSKEKKRRKKKKEQEGKTQQDEKKQREGKMKKILFGGGRGGVFEDNDVLNLHEEEDKEAEEKFSKRRRKHKRRQKSEGAEGEVSVDTYGDHKENEEGNDDAGIAMKRKKGAREKQAFSGDPLLQSVLSSYSYPMDETTPLEGRRKSSKYDADVASPESEDSRREKKSTDISKQPFGREKIESDAGREDLGGSIAGFPTDVVKLQRGKSIFLHDEEEAGKQEEEEEEEEEEEDETEEDQEQEEEEEEEKETVEEAKERCETELIIYFNVTRVRRMKAACCIQCAWRCSRARRALWRRQQLLYQEVYRRQKSAAMCIEGIFSSVLERRQLRQTQLRYAAAVEERIAWEENLFKQALVIARYAKVFLLRRRREKELCRILALRGVEELKLRAVAAAIVGRWWRIIVPRKAYWRRRTQEVEEQRRQEEIFRRQSYAATQIQRIVRGILGRREAQATRQRRVEDHRLRQRRLQDCTDLVRLCLQEYMRRCHRLKREEEQRALQRNEAAAVIQHGWKAALKRQMLHNVLTRCHRIVRAVLMIQRAYRRFCAGREIRYMRRVQLAMNQERLDNEYRVFRATMTLQTFGRMVIAKREARHRRAAIGRGFFFAAVTIQNACRGGTTRAQLRCALQLQREAAAQLEAQIQMRKDRMVSFTNAFVRARESCFLTERRRCRRLAEKLYIRRCVRRELLRDKSATVIQRAVRRWLARRRQREEEALALRTHVIVYIVRIQSAMRRFLAQKQYRLLRYLSQRQARKREEMEEVMVQLWIDEWRAAILQAEHDRRRIETREAEHRKDLQFRHKVRMLKVAEAAAAGIKYIEEKKEEEDDDKSERSLSTYRDDL
ncbi:hypothetical protein C3747_125g44 [Trypanosoma cruzi]|uniref:Uncharacterized protein n=2 Tax=Trypanosoma cruzi TaxID=5693 RepID=Q4D7V8_TRYCC|nr:hypothetical protein, conserved [Trypanosoma cruzi]EAN88611.1 hypothetical protein, conserved [Trypanosoma cruzi]PWV05745.1 hypothetical protein C3747_125g44 [Trypanosoma cruzi]|eukprot:XP_810462.1 hypothetical protein [Trypanosoma cruzi strain CL Brener]